MIVVATNDFERYHEAVTTLRGRGTTFTTIEPGDELPDRTSVVLTTREDVRTVDGEPGLLGDRTDADVVYADDGMRSAIEEALVILRGSDGRTVIGVDPGARPGIAVRVGETIVAAFQVPLADAVSVIERELDGAADPIVRIGDGARLHGAQIVNELPEVTIELVDETGTTPHLGSGASGMGDVLAAVNIASIEGEPIDSREIEPTAGELKRIKTESRQRSSGALTISESLARRVAAGDLTIEEAIDRHRNGEFER